MRVISEGVEAMNQNRQTAGKPLPRRVCGATQVYEPPTLMLIGAAADVVQGLPGGGPDGPYGISEPDFEFEADETE
jgi:hypothetical protein